MGFKTLPSMSNNIQQFSDQACLYLSNQDINHKSDLLQYIMELVSSLLCYQYDDVVGNENILMLIDMAVKGLLAQEESTVVQCQYFIHQLLTLFPNSISEPKTKYIILRLFNSYFVEIVQNCIQAMLTRDNLWCKKFSARILCVMNNGENLGITPSFKIDEKLVYKSLKKCRKKIISFQYTEKMVMKIVKFVFCLNSA
ncbi:hypothetical protein RF11_07485 [Thelohanellus kitauei]|uniref:Uncharacterized protein n=1 Tax=Thelohanellus kitauei TaxID=669202 RepID=A0A0C2J0Z4_THEKT|nr:hypothetical protein RF11_07485 [Thelohanellus kitauei]